MAYTRVWDESTPENTQLAKLGAQDMREIQQNVRERVASFGAGLAADRPTPEAVFVGVTYLSTDIPRLERWSGTAWVDITSSLIPSSGIGAVVGISGATLSIPDSAQTNIPFGVEIFDDGGLHDNAVSPSRFTIVVAGTYLVYANISFAANAVGYREVHIRRGGVSTVALGSQNAVVGDPTYLRTSGIIKLTPGEYVEAAVTQNSGGALNITSTTRFGIWKL